MLRIAPERRLHAAITACSVHLSPCGRGRIASTDAIRVRGYALSIDLNPSPQPSPTRGEGAHCRRREIEPSDFKAIKPFRCIIFSAYIDPAINKQPTTAPAPVPQD